MVEETSVPKSVVSDEDEIQSGNIDFVAALLCCGTKAYLDRDHIDRSDPQHVQFTVKGQSLSKVQEQWYKRELTVNARAYSDALREVRSEIRCHA